MTILYFSRRMKCCMCGISFLWFYHIVANMKLFIFPSTRREGHSWDACSQNAEKKRIFIIMSTTGCPKIIVPCCEQNQQHGTIIFGNTLYNVMWLSLFSIILPGDGHIESLGILEEAQFILIISKNILRAAPNSRHNDNSSLLTLELLSTSNHDVSDTLLGQEFPNLLHLSPVRSYNSYLLSQDL